MLYVVKNVYGREMKLGKVGKHTPQLSTKFGAKKGRRRLGPEKCCVCFNFIFRSSISTQYQCYLHRLWTSLSCSNMDLTLSLNMGMLMFRCRPLVSRTSHAFTLCLETKSVLLYFTPNRSLPADQQDCRLVILASYLHDAWDL